MAGEHDFGAQLFNALLERVGEFDVSRCTIIHHREPLKAQLAHGDVGGVHTRLRAVVNGNEQLVAVGGADVRRDGCPVDMEQAGVAKGRNRGQVGAGAVMRRRGNDAGCREFLRDDGSVFRVAAVVACHELDGRPRTPPLELSSATVGLAPFMASCALPTAAIVDGAEKPIQDRAVACNPDAVNTANTKRNDGASCRSRNMHAGIPDRLLLAGGCEVGARLPAPHFFAKSKVLLKLWAYVVGNCL